MTKITISQVYTSFGLSKFMILCYYTIMEVSIRRSNFELLRILAMFLIIASHMFWHSGVFSGYVYNNSLVNHINSFWALLFGYWGKLGVDLFIMITGYFLINSDFKIEKFFNLFFKTIFYSLIFLFVAIHYNLTTYNGNVLSTLKVFFDTYWFVKCYLFLYIFVPFINVFVKGLSDNLALKFLILGGVVWFLLPTFGINFGSSEIFVFFYIYVLGACIRLGKVKIISDLNLWKKLSFYSLVFLISTFVINIIKTSPFVNFNYLTKYSCLNSIFILIICIYLFNLFNGLNIQNNKIINWISGSVFGVYLIHDNGYINSYLWTKIFSIFKLMFSKYLILYIFGITLLVFVICVLIDKPVSFIFNKFFKLISQKIIKHK